MDRRTPENPGDIESYNDDVAKLFDDMPPFTIIINNGYDAAWISSAMLEWLAGGNSKLANRSMRSMIALSAEHGAEKGVSMFFEEGEQTGHRFPKFLKPVFIHMFKHVMEKYK